MKKILMIALAAAVTGALVAQMAPINGGNEVGFSTVPDTGSDTAIIAVPYVACLDGDADIMLSDLVATNGLISHGSNPADADQLIVLTTNAVGDLRYCYYWLQGGTGWTAVTSSVKHPDGSTEAFTPPAASAFPVSRGKGFWLKRVVSSVADLYVKGEVSTSNPSTTIQPALNLVGYGAAAALELNSNSINWSGAFGSADGKTQGSDKIIVMNADGTTTSYYYFVCPDGSAWDAWRALDNKWINSDYSLATRSVPAGLGFWYQRRGTVPFNFQPDDN